MNDSTDKDHYLDEKIGVVYPKVDNLVDLIKLKGASCMLFKKDLRMEYHQVFIDPLEYHKVGYRFKRKLFDTTVSMGLQSGAQICQRVTNAITYIMFMIGVAILNYLDDLAGAEVQEKAHCWIGFWKEHVFQNRKRKLVLQARKCVGVLFDTIKMTSDWLGD